MPLAGFRETPVGTGSCAVTGVRKRLHNQHGNRGGCKSHQTLVFFPLSVREEAAGTRHQRNCGPEPRREGAVAPRPGRPGPGPARGRIPPRRPGICLHRGHPWRASPHGRCRRRRYIPTATGRQPEEGESEDGATSGPAGRSVCGHPLTHVPASAVKRRRPDSAARPGKHPGSTRVRGISAAHQVILKRASAVARSSPKLVPLRITAACSGRSARDGWPAA